MRNPNGYGTVVKLAGNRRNPYKPKKVIGFDSNHNPIILPGFPAFEKQTDADIFLATYNKEVKEEDTGMHIKKSDLTIAIKVFKDLQSKNKDFKISHFIPADIVNSALNTGGNKVNTPTIIGNGIAINNMEDIANDVLIDNNIDINANDMSEYTVKQVYEAWGNEVFPTKEEIAIAKETKIKTRGKLSQANTRSLQTAYNYLKDIHDFKYKNLTSDDYQKILDNCDKSDSILSAIKNLMQKLDTYAGRKGIIDKKPSDFVTVEYRKIRKQKIPFTNEQIHKFWTKDGLLWADIMLFLLYTGMRIEESFDVRTEDIHLEQGYFTGGIKTQAGIDRVIPIHKAIIHIIERYYNPNNKYLFMYKGNKISKSTYYLYYGPMLEELEMPNIVPHTSRVTFRSELDRKCNLSQKNCIDKIMGHITADVGKDIYTKKDLNELAETINKVTYDIAEEHNYIVVGHTAKQTEEQQLKNLEIRKKAMKDFEGSLQETRDYKRFLNKINKTYENAKDFDELAIVQKIAEYNKYLKDINFNKDYFFKCRDAIDNIYQYYYKHFILKSIKKKKTEEIFEDFKQNITTIISLEQVRKTLIMIIYYDTLLNYYKNEFTKKQKMEMVFGLNRLIEHYTNHYKREVVTKYRCNVSLFIKKDYDLDNLKSNFEFIAEDDFYKSPDNSIWVNKITRKIENMSILSQEGLYDTWINKFKDLNISCYSISG